MAQSAARVMNDDPERLYQGLLDVVRQTAAACGLKISSGTDHRWKVLVSAARRLDAIIDAAVESADPEQLVEVLEASLMLLRGTQVAAISQA